MDDDNFFLQPFDEDDNDGYGVETLKLFDSDDGMMQLNCSGFRDGKRTHSVDLIDMV